MLSPAAASHARLPHSPVTCRALCAVCAGTKLEKMPVTTRSMARAAAQAAQNVGPGPSASPRTPESRVIESMTEDTPPNSYTSTSSELTFRAPLSESDEHDSTVPTPQGAERRAFVYRHGTVFVREPTLPTRHHRELPPNHEYRPA